MCLAIPMQVIALEAGRARCAARGAERMVDLAFLPPPAAKPGEHLLVHSGMAVQRLSAEEAAETWALYDRILAATGEA